MADTAADSGGLELSLVVPTFNEHENVPELLRRIETALAGIDWEVVVVDDDSPDGTASAIREIARKNPRVRCLQRVGRRGLSSACIEGIFASAAPVIAVMDGDLQHDETRLPEMLRVLVAENADIVIGTRYAGDGGVGDWDASRLAMSRLATGLSRLICRQHVSDPMSGFFMLRRTVAEDSVHRLSGLGFKILLDLLASSTRQLRVAEVPYTFSKRLAGESKLDSLVVWDFGMLLVDKLVGRYVPARFVAFAIVGGFGVFVHMGVMSALLKGADTSFTLAQSSAAVVAMVFNFAVNNVLTYRDMRLRGGQWWRGLATFVAACSIGALANVGVASYLFESRTQWVLAALAGIAVGAVWNYVVTMVYTWGRRKS